MTEAGLPHSETRGSACSAAPRGVSSPCHVLHRHPAPRHPPRASTLLGPCPGRRCVAFAARRVCLLLVRVIQVVFAWLVGWCWSPCHPADTRPAGRPEGVCLWLVVWFVGGWFCVRPLRVMAKPCDRPGHHLTAWRAWQRQAPACHAVPTAQLSCLALRRFAVRRFAALDLLYCLLRTIFSW